MNNSKKSHDLVRQNEKNVQKSQKHDANLQKNSTLYFQVGLIICLLFAYGALEMSFKSSEDYVYAAKEIDEGIPEIDVEDYEIVKKVVKQPVEEIVKPKPKNPDIEIVDNKTKLEKLEKQIIKKIPVVKMPVVSTNDPTLTPVEPQGPINIMVVQKVPVYPGCESASNNNERRKCMSSKLSKLIQRKFDTDIASDLGLSGEQKIYVSFKINKQGEVEILKTRAPHPELDKEAKRVVGKIPTMQPGENDNKAVEVSYMLPINFNIQ